MWGDKSRWVWSLVLGTSSLFNYGTLADFLYGPVL